MSILNWTLPARYANNCLTCTTPDGGDYTCPICDDRCDRTKYEVVYCSTCAIIFNCL